MDQVEVDGLRIAYERAGEGPPPGLEDPERFNAELRGFLRSGR